MDWLPNDCLHSSTHERGEFRSTPYFIMQVHMLVSETNLFVYVLIHLPDLNPLLPGAGA
jgi:hypothetical protein